MLGDAVAVTLGPGGGNVTYSRPFGGPKATKDGWDVTQQIDSEDPTERIGIDIIREAARKTVAQVGDGTTSATVLGQKMINDGVSAMIGGASGIELKRGIDLAVSDAIAALPALTQSLKDAEGNIDWDKVRSVGTISGNNDESIGELITNVLKEIGPAGSIILEEGRTTETKVDTIPGMQFNQGVVAGNFITHKDTATAEFNNPLILLCAGKIRTWEDLEPLYNQLFNTTKDDAPAPMKEKFAKKPILIVCKGIEPTPLKGVIENLAWLKAAVVKAPDFDNELGILKDLAAFTGARIALEGEPLLIENLGSAERIISGARTTTVIKGHGNPDDVVQRVKEVTNEVKEALDEYTADRAAERLSKLSGGVSNIKVGAVNDMEMKARKALMEDAIRATKAAIEEGIVPGGGTTYIRLSQSLSGNNLTGDVLSGYNIVRRALSYPAWLIARNAAYTEYPGDLVVATVLKESGDYGFNAKAGKFENLLEAKIIDPAKVVRCAIVNAAACAGVFLTTQATIAESYDVKQPVRG